MLIHQHCVTHMYVVTTVSHLTTPTLQLLVSICSTCSWSVWVCDHLCLLHCSMQTQSPIVNLFIILFQYSYPKCGCTWGQCMESAHGEHFTPHACSGTSLQRTLWELEVCFCSVSIYNIRNTHLYMYIHTSSCECSSIYKYILHVYTS